MTLEIQVSTSAANHPNAAPLSFLGFPKDYYLDEGNVSFVLITRHHNICFKLPVVELQHSNVQRFKKDMAGFSAEVFC